MANFHPEEHVLTAFAAGSLSLSHAVCVAGHLEYCSDCQSSVRALSAVGGDMLESLPAEPVSDVLRAAVFARLSEPAAAVQEKQPPRHKRVPGLPRCLDQFDLENIDSLTWEKQSGSISTATVATDSNGERLELLRIAPGGQLSSHTHMGEELTLVLSGSFSDEEGVYTKGDFMLLDENHEHTPLATSDCECICLTVQQGPIQFTGPLMRVMNPYLRYGFKRSMAAFQ